MNPDISQLKMIHLYSDAEKLELLNRICMQFYIARNISMNHQTIQDSLAMIDRLYRTPSESEECDY